MMWRLFGACDEHCSYNGYVRGKRNRPQRRKERKEDGEVLDALWVDGTVRVIPTLFKSKLPKTLSWPVGAEAITAGLGDAPHAGEYGLWFSDSPVWRASEFQRTLRAGRPYAVLVVEYTPAVRMGYS